MSGERRHTGFQDSWFHMPFAILGLMTSCEHSPVLLLICFVLWLILCTLLSDNLIGILTWILEMGTGPGTKSSCADTCTDTHPNSEGSPSPSMLFK